MDNKKYIALGLSIFVIAGIIISVVIFTRPNGLIYPAPTVNPPVGVTNPPPYVPKDGVIQPVMPLEQQADYIIDIVSIGFSPDTLNVNVGDSVIWTSRDKYNNHQIISTGIKHDGVDSPVLRLGESWRVTFNTVGTWTYQDKLHPNLKGSIVVE